MSATVHEIVLRIAVPDDGRSERYSAFLKLLDAALEATGIDLIHRGYDNLGPYVEVEDDGDWEAMYRMVEERRLADAKVQS